MIVQRVQDKLLVVRQADHGVQTGAFAAHWEWGADADTRTRSKLIEATTRHDNGWAAWDASPDIDPETQQPYQFVKIPRHEHVALYRRGILEAAEVNPYLGLLVSMHGAGLYNDRYGTWRLREQHFSTEEQALVDEFLSDQSELQAKLAHQAGLSTGTLPADNPQVWHDYVAMQVWDRLSLQFVWRLAGDGEISPLSADRSSPSVLVCENAGRMSLKLTPYPFDRDNLVFPVEARFVRDREYRSPEDFLEEYLRAGASVIDCTAKA